MNETYSFRRQALSGEAMIATSHQLATAAGIEILSEGGNAVDAALAAVAVQCVVEPHMTGIGGDCFALYAPAKGQVTGLNGSGRAPAAASAATLRERGWTTIPHESAHAVTIPGAVSAWIRLHDDYGSLALGRLFQSAIRYAEEGYPVTHRVAYDWNLAAKALSQRNGTAAVFVRDGKVPKKGDLHAQPLLGQRLREIARDGAAAFYTGTTAKSLVRTLQALGGVQTEDDFALGAETAEYVDPIAGNYSGFELLECPPNGQGVIALLILDMLQGKDLSDDVPLWERIHIHAQATRIAYQARSKFLADPRQNPGVSTDLIEFARRAVSGADMNPFLSQDHSMAREEEHRDTICLSVVDRQGNAISLINSIFQAFGSYILDSDTGILLHSRGSSFSLQEGHPNMLAPGKRPMHTIIPGMLSKDGRVVMPFGVMGGHYQAAGHAALISGILDQGLDIQAAIDAPRSFLFDNVLQVEPAVDAATRIRLAELGYDVRVAGSPIGGAQAIWIDHARGVLWGGSDPRKDGCALGI